MDFEREKQVCLFYASQWEQGLPSENLVEFRAWLDDMILKIPSQYRSSATIEIGLEGGYEDSHSVNIEINYICPKTEDDLKQEADKDEDYRQRMERQERIEFERLAKKYGGA